MGQKKGEGEGLRSKRVLKKGARKGVKKWGRKGALAMMNLHPSFLLVRRANVTEKTSNS